MTNSISIVEKIIIILTNELYEVNRDLDNIKDDFNNYLSNKASLRGKLELLNSLINTLMKEFLV